MPSPALLLLPLCLAAVSDKKPKPPNVVYILADDLGYGDVKCLNHGGKIATPNLDLLASQGMAFTDAHSGSSVCTPTRYGILTGRYAWRSPLKRGVLGGYSPRLIEEGRLTVPALLKKHGYHTACVGKWHLGKEDKGLPAVQLYDMASDVGETTNVQEKHPAVVERLTKLLRKYVDEGRSTPAKK